MTVRFDYDDDPDRYRLGIQNTCAHAATSLYQRIADLLAELEVRIVLDVGCAEGVLSAAIPATGPRLIGLDRSETLLRAHPGPAIRADAVRLPVRTGSVDAVTAVNVFYHLTDPMPAIRESYRVLTDGGHLLAATIARSDSPELRDFWTSTPTSFDAEEAPDLIAKVFDSVVVERWDAPLVTLPTASAVRDYLLGRQASVSVADTAAREVPLPLTITKRGALIHAVRRDG